MDTSPLGNVAAQGDFFTAEGFFEANADFGRTCRGFCVPDAVADWKFSKLFESLVSDAAVATMGSDEEQGVDEPFV